MSNVSIAFHSMNVSVARNYQLFLLNQTIDVARESGSLRAAILISVKFVWNYYPSLLYMMLKTFYVNIVFFIGQQEKNAISTDKMFSNQLLMIGVIMGCGYTKRMTMRSFLFHYLFSNQMIED